MTLITRVNAEGLIDQLADELVTSYTAEDLTITQIVTDLLAFQILTPAITVGTIEPTVTRSISVVGDTILRAIYRLRDTVGGFPYVDDDRALQWRTTIGKDKGQQIRYRKNLRGIARDIDYTTLANRLYAYGAGEGDARIKLSDAEGQTEDYIEDTDSQRAYPDGWGGIYKKVIVDKSITHPDTLLAWAQLRLADLKNPRITYRLDTVDLFESDEVNFSFEILQLGSTITVIDEDLGIDVSAQVVKITHPDLLHPEQMEIEVANRTKDISDSLAEVYDIQQLVQHIATKIGAGQVIVKGAFTVKDWVTAGETTIVGSHIETGTITAAQLSAGEIITGSAQIKDGIITNAKIDTLAAGKITGLIDGSHIELDGDTVVRGDFEVSGDAIFGGTIDARYVRVSHLDADEIDAGSLSGDRIYGGTITGVIFSQAGGNVIINSGGVIIKGAKLRLKDSAGGHAAELYVDTNGHLRLDSWGYVNCVWLYAAEVEADGVYLDYLNKKGSGAIVVDDALACKDIKPQSHEIYNCGYSNKAWLHGVFKWLYSGDGSVYEYQGQDDIALLKAIRGIKRNGRRIIDARTLPQDLVIRNPRKQKYINVPGLAGFNIGVMKEIVNRLEALEAKVS